VRGYDVILSSSHAVAKGILTHPQQMHVCYCHTPMRYAWDLTFDYLRSSRMGRGLQGWITRYLLHQIRQWDVLSANRVDYFIANSTHTARRIWRCYRRTATVIYPPVNIERFPFQAQKEDFYLTVSRLVSYKRVSLIIEAFNQLGRPLVVVGTGPELEAIRKLAQPNVQVLGFQPDSVVEQYMAKAKAFVYAACEDFGIALVEAQACGTPVIAYGAGGALETVRDIRQHPDSGTGLFFKTQSAAALIEAVKIFEASEGAFSPERSRLNAAGFAPKIFGDRYLAFLERCYEDYQLRFSPDKF
jgi:glycosyltransferase involved in cell wall biosynthesis